MSECFRMSIKMLKIPKMYQIDKVFINEATVNNSVKPRRKMI